MRIGESKFGGFLDAGHDVEPALVSRIRNPHLVRYIGQGLFAGCLKEEYIGRRIEEYIRLCEVLDRDTKTKPLADRLLACNKDAPSNFSFSPLCRQRRIEQTIRLVDSVFDGIPDQEMHLVTIIIKVISGTPDKVAGQAEQHIAAFRRKLRNHLNEWSAKRTWYRSIKHIGVFEIERYQYRPTAKQANKAGLPNALTGRQMKRLKPRKTKLLRKLGWDPARKEDFYVLHYHCVVNLQFPKAYKRRLRKNGMFPGPRRVDVKRFRSEKPRDENIRRTVAYIHKTAPRQGALFQKDRRPLLSPDAMAEFAVLYSRLPFQKLRFDIGTNRRTSRSRVN